MSDQTWITADDRIFVAGHRGMAVDLRRKQLWVPVGFAHGSSPGGGDHLALDRLAGVALAAHVCVPRWPRVRS